MRDKQHRGARCNASTRHLEVRLNRVAGRDRLRAHVTPRRSVGAAQRCNLGAHQGAIHDVVTQDARAVVVAAALESRVHETVRQIVARVAHQVHRHEGHVADHVGTAQSGVEFKAIEHRRLSIDQRHVAQVQVAMAFAHPPLCTPPRKVALQRAEGARFPSAQIGQAFALRLAQHGVQRIESLEHGHAKLRGFAEARVGRAHRSVAMQPTQALGELIDVLRLQATALNQLLPEPVLRESAHPQSDVDDCAAPAQGGQPALARDGDDVEIELRRKSPIQAQFLLAEMAPQRQGREVQEAEVHRLLDLVGTGAVEQHERDVGFDQSNRLPGMRCAE